MQVKFRQYLQSDILCTDLRVVIFKIFVGSLTGPLTRRFLSFALLMRSVETIEQVSTGMFKEESHGKRTFFKILNIPRGQGDPDFVDLGGWKGSASGIVFLISLSDVTHDGRVRR